MTFVQMDKPRKYSTKDPRVREQRSLKSFIALIVSKLGAEVLDGHTIEAIPFSITRFKIICHKRDLASEILRTSLGQRKHICRYCEKMKLHPQGRVDSRFNT